MRKGEGLALAIVVAVALFVGGWAIIPQHGIFRGPYSATKTFALIAVLATALAAPFAVAEAWGDRRFRVAARDLERARDWQRVREYDEEAGRGLAFETADRRVLLLRPVGGIGAPRVVEEPVPALEPEDEPPAST